jgi:hypothetical protein
MKTSTELTKGQKKSALKVLILEATLSCVNKYGVCTLSAPQIVERLYRKHSTKVHINLVTPALQELEAEGRIAYSNNPKKGVAGNWIGRFFKIVIHPSSELYAQVKESIKNRFGYLWNHLTTDLKSLKQAIKRAFRWNNIIPSLKMKEAIHIAKMRKSTEYINCTKRYGQTPYELYKSQEENGYHLLDDGELDFEILVDSEDQFQFRANLNHERLLASL